jgi:hypothetical protein
MGPAGTQNSWRGDVARALFYMAVRYNGLQVVSGNPANTTVGQMGDLDSLLAWHISDPPDDFEMYRNNYIYTWQQNRNPFIDMPQIAQYIFGNNQGQVWQNPNYTTSITNSSMLIYPNPTTNAFTISGIDDVFEWRLLNLLGVLIQQGKSKSSERIDLQVPTGLYLLEVQHQQQLIRTKLQVQRF